MKRRQIIKGAALLPAAFTPTIINSLAEDGLEGDALPEGFSEYVEVGDDCCLEIPKSSGCVIGFEKQGEKRGFGFAWEHFHIGRTTPLCIWDLRIEEYNTIIEITPKKEDSIIRVSRLEPPKNYNPNHACLTRRIYKSYKCPKDTTITFKNTFKHYV